MNKTKIEWVKNPDGSQGYTLNDKTGCLNHVNGMCKGGNFPCYAYKLAHGRLINTYRNNENIAEYCLYGEGSKDNAFLDPFYPRFWPERLEQIRKHKNPAGIFLNDMADWMGDYWPEEWTEAELQVMKDNPHHRIYTLTKQPQNLIKWSPFPPNCYVGVTACNEAMFNEALWRLSQIQAAVTFISVEPFLNRIPTYSESRMKIINWLIIGALTSKTWWDLDKVAERHQIPKSQVMRFGNIWTLQPKIEWVEEIIEAADKADIPVFLKNNLMPIVPPFGNELFPPAIRIRQEMPK